MYQKQWNDEFCIKNLSIHIKFEGFGFDNISVDEKSCILMLIHFDKNILIYDILKWIYGLDIF